MGKLGRDGPAQVKGWLSLVPPDMMPRKEPSSASLVFLPGRRPLSPDIQVEGHPTEQKGCAFRNMEIRKNTEDYSGLTGH